MIDELVDNERLVYSIINKYGGNYNREDLYQVGMIGLINASKNFNKDIGVKFSTYAYKYILGEITKYLREDKNIKVSRDVIKLKQSIGKAKDLLRQKLSREPSNLEVSLILDIDEEKIDEIDALTTEVESLDFNYQDNDSNLYNSIKVEDKDTNPNILDLKEEIKALTLEEKKIIYSRYYDELTQTETSKVLGISQVQVSRKETKILQKLRTRL